MSRHFPPIVPFGSFMNFTPTLPNLYWNVDSHEERIKKLCIEFCKMIDYVNSFRDTINGSSEAINELTDEFEDFKEHGFEEFYEEQLDSWINDNFAKVMKEVLNYGVFFGLTDDGYFTANVAWQLSTVFDTDMNYRSENYGHLILKY